MVRESTIVHTEATVHFRKTDRILISTSTSILASSRGRQPSKCHVLKSILPSFSWRIQCLMLNHACKSSSYTCDSSRPMSSSLTFFPCQNLMIWCYSNDIIMAFLSPLRFLWPFGSDGIEYCRMTHQSLLFLHACGFDLPKERESHEENTFPNIRYPFDKRLILWITELTSLSESHSSGDQSRKESEWKSLQTLHHWFEDAS